jgi:hypothetical protein
MIIRLRYVMNVIIGMPRVRKGPIAWQRQERQVFGPFFLCRFIFQWHIQSPLRFLEMVIVAMNTSGFGGLSHQNTLDSVNLSKKTGVVRIMSRKTNPYCLPVIS